MSDRKVAVANVSDLKDGEMRGVSADGTPILLARVAGECYAVGAHCTHYGAPLAEGYLSGDRIVCPWHHACFDVKTGRFEEPPAFDSLPKFDLSIEDDKIYVRLPDVIPDRETSNMAKRDKKDDRVYVILGGGAAGYMAAQTLREDGFTGRVVLVTRDDRLPYDRPNLSKDYLSGNAEPAWMPIRSREFFEENEIEVMTNTEAAEVDSKTKTVSFKNGTNLKFDSLLIATGGEARKLPVQPDSAENIFLLRNFAHADKIIASAEKGKHAVIIGASFIGMEAASSLRARGCEVTVITPDEVPFRKTLGAEIGKLFQDIHEENGVKFRLGARVKGFEGGAKVKSVLLEVGEKVPADFVVVGVGVKPATGSLSGIELEDDGGIATDVHMRVGADIFAAGDIVHFPDHRTGELTHIEHWRTALQQGRTAAHNMAGNDAIFAAVPFFWTTQFGVTLNYVGHVSDWDRVIIQGEIGKRDFLAFYVKDHRIMAVAGMNHDRDLAVWEELIRQNRVPEPSRLKENPADLLHELPDLSSYAAPKIL